MKNLWVAASDNEIELVKKYLDGGASANSKDENGYTPIHAAVSYDNFELLDLLINKYQGNINIADEEGDTPLHYCESLQMLKTLVEQYGVKLGAKNEEGKTLLNTLEEDLDENDEQYYVKTEMVRYLKFVEADVSRSSEFTSPLLKTTTQDTKKARRAEEIDTEAEIEKLIERVSADDQKRIKEVMESGDEEKLNAVLSEIVSKQFSGVNVELSSKKSKN